MLACDLRELLERKAPAVGGGGGEWGGGECACGGRSGGTKGPQMGGQIRRG